MPRYYYAPQIPLNICSGTNAPLRSAYPAILLATHVCHSPKTKPECTIWNTPACGSEGGSADLRDYRSPAVCSCSITLSKLKVAAFWRGGYSLKVCKKFPTLRNDSESCQMWLYGDRETLIKAKAWLEANFEWSSLWIEKSDRDFIYPAGIENWFDAKRWADENGIDLSESDQNSTCLSILTKQSNSIETAFKALSDYASLLPDGERKTEVTQFIETLKDDGMTVITALNSLS